VTYSATVTGVFLNNMIHYFKLVYNWNVNTEMFGHEDLFMLPALSRAHLLCFISLCSLFTHTLSDPLSFGRSSAGAGVCSKNSCLQIWACEWWVDTYG